MSQFILLKGLLHIVKAINVINAFSLQK